MHLDFEMFSDSLLSSSHNFFYLILCKLDLYFCINFTDDCSIISKVIKLKSVLVFTKSLMYVRKRRGPRIDPWGTPVVICAISEFWLSKLKYCWLFERYNTRRSLEIPEIPKYESYSNNISWFKVSCPKILQRGPSLLASKMKFYLWIPKQQIQFNGLY